MFFGRWSSWRAAINSRAASRFTLCLCSAGLLAGCGDAGSPLAGTYSTYEPTGAWSKTQVDVTLADYQTRAEESAHLFPPPPTLAEEPADVFLPPPVPTPPAPSSIPVEEVEESDGEARQEPARDESQSDCWAFPTVEADVQIRNAPALKMLPVVEELPPVEPVAVGRSESRQTAAVQPPDEQPGHLLPPRAIVVELSEPPSLYSAPDRVATDSTAQIPLPDFAATPPVEQFAEERSEPCEIALIQRHNEPPDSQGLLASKPQQNQKLPASGNETAEHSGPALAATALLPALEELSQQQQQLTALLKDSSSAVTGVLTDHRMNELAKTKIQQAYAMASRGALYVARQELIEVLRMISQAKDALQGTPKRTVALAAGLRALREAEDFAPRGTQLEAELDITVLCASHRTPVAKQPESANLLPRLMMDRYLRYAQLQLAMSVAGEPAGSMALHALGKLNSQLGRAEPAKHQLAERHAIAYQQAALLAHNQNHLAAHELGVLLATSGHFVEAQQLLLQVAAREPNAVVYGNLARIQDKLGQPGPALANRDLARQLSQMGATGANNVQWVSPDQFAQASVQAPRYSTAQSPITNQLVIPGSRPMAQSTLRR